MPASFFGVRRLEHPSAAVAPGTPPVAAFSWFEVIRLEARTKRRQVGALQD
jgi:hypothetical protein